MEIKIITEQKKQFLDLLLLADEQESMIDLYLERGTMFALYREGRICSLCVVTKEQEGVYEIKNMVTSPVFQRQGYGKKLLFYVIAYYQESCHTMLVGTGESQGTLSFYKSCGFVPSHRVKNFFVENYDHPIIEEGKQLKDMIYLKKEYKNSPMQR